jgi:hypothetical protein
MDGWMIVFSTDQDYKAEIANEILDENDIEAVIMNKKDSNYKFGEIEVYVMDEDVELARKLLKELIL